VIRGIVGGLGVVGFYKGVEELCPGWKYGNMNL